MDRNTQMTDSGAPRALMRRARYARSACSARRVPLRGYTLLEMLAVITIISILASIAVPQFTVVTASSSISSNINSLTASFDLARSEAIARNTLVIVCRAADIRLAAPSCSDAAIGNIASPDWASGWIIYAKPDTATAVSAFDPGSDMLIRRIEPESVRASGDRSLMVAAPATAMVAWAGNGQRATDLTSTTPIFTVDFQDPALSSPSVRARCLSLSIIGRARIGQFSSGACDAS